MSWNLIAATSALGDAAEAGWDCAPTFQPHSVVHAAENIKGGVGAYLRDLLVMQRASFGAGVVTALVPQSQREMVGSPEGVTIVSFDDSGNRLLSTLNLARRMREIVERSDPNIVHLHSTFAGAALRPLLRVIRSRAAVVYCAHGWAFDRDTSSVSRCFAKLLERNLARWCDAVVCISGHEVRAAEQIGIPAAKIVKVSNGIPCEAPRIMPRPVGVHWPEGKRRVLFVGRFDRQKGTDLLLAALAELQDCAFCYLVGDTVLGDADAIALPPNAGTTGWLSAAELQAYYHSADVLVAPSRWEGFGLTAAEAMRAGLPVIASRVGGLVEIVADGLTGLLIPPGDKHALVSALRDTSKERLTAMGEAGRERFLEHFTLERVHKQLTALYRHALSRKAQAPLLGQAPAGQE